MSTSSYLAMQKQLEQASRALRPAYLDSFQQMEKALEPFRRSHLALAEQLKVSGVVTRMQEIAQANQRMLTSFDKIKIDTRGIDNLARVHASWMRNVQASADRLSHIQASAKLALTSASQMATIAETFSTRIDFDRIRNAFKFQDDIVAQLQGRFENLTSGFDRLALAVESLPKLTALPSFVLPSASREVLVTGRAVMELWPDDAEDADDEQASVLADVREETSGVFDLLSRVNPALAKAYQGAREALSGGGIDRGRHVLASLRELWGHLLRSLASDENVIPWLSGKHPELLHEGKPTRRARILYVCREINHEPLSDFLDSDTKALVEYVQFLNRVHQLETGLSDRQLNALLLRTDSWLTFMIQISEEGHEC